jgi:hypothetical protein
MLGYLPYGKAGAVVEEKAEISRKLDIFSVNSRDGPRFAEKLSRDRLFRYGTFFSRPAPGT